MKTATAPSTAISIYLAGDYDDARRACRAFCEEGLCVTVERCAFIYTRGEEAGVKVGLVNYPRFPNTPEALSTTARRLAEHLLTALFQWSVLIVGPAETVWLTSREAGAEEELAELRRIVDQKREAARRSSKRRHAARRAIKDFRP